MNQKTILDLECPSKIDKKKCRGDFHAEILTQKNNEILNGFLICQRCKKKYPVICGIPILLDDLKRYFKNNFVNIKYVIGKKKIHKEIFLYIITLTRSLFKKEEDSALFKPGHAKGEESGYFLLHYGSLSQTAHTALLNDLINLHKDNNAYEIIKGWLSKKKDLGQKKAIDVGCSTGGLTHLLSRNCSFSYGIDISYRNLFSASRVTKHIPSRLDYYKVREGGRLKKKNIRIKKADNIDFILASADNIPFKDKTFGISLSSSLLDIARNNIKILKEAQRTLRKEGEIFLSFVPFFSELKEGKRESSLIADNIKRCTKDIQFLKEFRNIPFILRNAENFYNVYENYCMIGKKIR